MVAVRLDDMPFIPAGQKLAPCVMVVIKAGSGDTDMRTESIHRQPVLQIRPHVILRFRLYESRREQEGGGPCAATVMSSSCGSADARLFGFACAARSWAGPSTEGRSSKETCYGESSTESGRRCPAPQVEDK